MADVCLQLGISDATFNVRQKKHADRVGTELRELRPLTDLSLDKQSLGEIVRKNV